MNVLKVKNQETVYTVELSQTEIDILHVVCAHIAGNGSNREVMGEIGRTLSTHVKNKINVKNDGYYNGIYLLN